jgi:hypothetical protein
VRFNWFRYLGKVEIWLYDNWWIIPLNYLPRKQPYYLFLWINSALIALFANLWFKKNPFYCLCRSYQSMSLFYQIIATDCNWNDGAAAATRNIWIHTVVMMVTHEIKNPNSSHRVGSEKIFQWTRRRPNRDILHEI